MPGFEPDSDDDGPGAVQYLQELAALRDDLHKTSAIASMFPHFPTHATDVPVPSSAFHTAPEAEVNQIWVSNENSFRAWTYKYDASRNWMGSY